MVVPPCWVYPGAMWLYFDSLYILQWLVGAVVADRSCRYSSTRLAGWRRLELPTPPVAALTRGRQAAAVQVRVPPLVVRRQRVCTTPSLRSGRSCGSGRQTPVAQALKSQGSGPTWFLAGGLCVCPWPSVGFARVWCERCRVCRVSRWSGVSVWRLQRLRKTVPLSTCDVKRDLYRVDFCVPCREMVKASVFQPDTSLPTMTIEEFAELEVCVDVWMWMCGCGVSQCALPRSKVRVVWIVGVPMVPCSWRKHRLEQRRSPLRRRQSPLVTSRCVYAVVIFAVLVLLMLLLLLLLLLSMLLSLLLLLFYCLCGSLVGGGGA